MGRKKDGVHSSEQCEHAGLYGSSWGQWALPFLPSQRTETPRAA